MSATLEQQLAELRRANGTLRQERDAALAELRGYIEQAAVTGVEIIKSENEELRAAQAAGLEVLHAMAASPQEIGCGLSNNGHLLQTQPPSSHRPWRDHRAFDLTPVAGTG